MDLQEALDQMAHIRRQLAHSATFRGYRAFPAAVSSVAAILAAVVQSWFLPAPSDQPLAFVGLWVAVAVATAAVQLAEIFGSGLHAGSVSSERLTVRALELLIPCIVAGGLLTLSLVLFAPETIWLLPGLWSILLSQGVFASLPILPRSAALVGYYYLAAGVGCLVLARGDWALSPWSMALSFGGGQALTALILYLTLERHHD